MTGHEIELIEAAVAWRIASAAYRADRTDELWAAYAERFDALRDAVDAVIHDRQP